MTDERRALPSVSALLQSAALRPLSETTPHARLVEATRAAIAEARLDVSAAPRDEAQWAANVARALAEREPQSLRSVINATGVVLHTNLGRAPLAQVAIDAMTQLAGGYGNVEYDLTTGARGKRDTYASDLLRELTGADDALVVNNCAAALVLAVDTVARDREVILSRGELVEIGGSFRVHEILTRSGAMLREVGATNRTHLADYARAICSDTGALLKVHPSNYAMSGFVTEVQVHELVPLAREHGLPILHDLGSGLLLPLDDLGLRGEPTARDALAAGASLVMMSGDKLLGGPQAGIVAGDAALIQAMRTNPLARAYRVDKMTLAALGATLALYREPERARREIPILAMLAEPVSSLQERARHYCERLYAAGIGTSVTPSTAAVGAGAFPTAALPSVALELEGDAERWSAALRAGAMPVVGRTVSGRHRLDMRTVPPPMGNALVDAVVAARG